MFTCVYYSGLRVSHGTNDNFINHWVIYWQVGLEDIALTSYMTQQWSIDWFTEFDEYMNLSHHDMRINRFFFPQYDLGTLKLAGLIIYIEMADDVYSK